MIIWLVILVLLGVAAVWVVRSLARPDGTWPKIGRGSSGLDVLEERYARGEIDREEYLQKKKDIMG